MKRIVGVADMAVSNNPGDTIITYSLGSCIGLIVYDPVVRVGGILHFMLPDSTIDRDKAAAKPCMFADTGIPLLFKTAYTFGAVKKRMTVYVAGGAEILDQKGFFNIGKRNYLALKQIFFRNNVIIDKQDVGGSLNRTIRIQIGTGAMFNRTAGCSEVQI